MKSRQPRIAEGASLSEYSNNKRSHLKIKWVRLAGPFCYSIGIPLNFLWNKKLSGQERTGLERSYAAKTTALGSRNTEIFVDNCTVMRYNKENSYLCKEMYKERSYAE